MSKLELTDAIELINPNIELVEGYRHATYVSDDGDRLPMIIATASKSVLFELFISLISRLGVTIDFVLDDDRNGFIDYRESIDTAVLVSILIEFEELLLNDGMLGVAAMNPGRGLEVQLEEHKMLVIYGSPQELFEFELESYGVLENEGIRTIYDYEHRHVWGEDHEERLDELRVALGLDGTEFDDDDELLTDHLHPPEA